MIDLCQKLHICTYNRENFYDDRPPFGNFAPPHWPPQSGRARTAPGRDFPAAASLPMINGYINYQK